MGQQRFLNECLAQLRRIVCCVRYAETILVAGPNGVSKESFATNGSMVDLKSVSAANKTKVWPMLNVEAKPNESGKVCYSATIDLKQ